MSPMIALEEPSLNFNCDRDDTLLRAALRAGIGVPYECNVGGCGTCKFQLVEGNVETRWSEAPGLTVRDRARGRHLACQCHPLSACKIRFIGAAEEPGVVVRPQKRVAELIRSRNVTHDIREFSFRTAQPAEFKPGQYALFDIPGVAGSRAYSMSNLPNGDGIWQFMIRRVPDGRGTAVLFDELEIGATIVIDGAYGHAWLRQDSGRNVVCVAGGSGIAPMISIARSFAIDQNFADRQLTFFLGGRRAIDIAGPDEFAMSAVLKSRWAYFAAVSEADEPIEHWRGDRGFIHEHLHAKLGDFSQYDFYLAGPPRMVEAVTGVLRQRNVSNQQVRYDRFF